MCWWVGFFEDVMTASAYMFACFGEAFHQRSGIGLGEREKRIRRALRVKKRRGVVTGAFACFTAGLHANGSSGPAGVARRGSMVPRSSRAAQDRLHYCLDRPHVSVLGPKVYDPTLAKKTLNRTEPTQSERHKDCEEKMPLQQLLRKEEVHEDEFISPTGALDQYLFRNLPDASMQLGQERHRREVCSSKLQEIEKELQEFSDAFGSKLQELKKSMGEFAQSMKELMHYDEGTYIEDRLWEEADTNSKAVDTVTSTQSPPHR